MEEAAEKHQADGEQLWLLIEFQQQTCRKDQKHEQKMMGM